MDRVYIDVNKMGEFMMLRQDGSFEIYILEHQTKDGKEWHGSGDGEHFCNNKGTFRDEPRRSFNALGRCWQVTGVHGCFEKKMAMKMVMLVACENPDRKFRIKRVTIHQESDIVVQTF
jgi:hypothetical protein